MRNNTASDFSGNVQGGKAQVDLILKITKVVTTKRPCIPVALIKSLSGMTDPYSHALMVAARI